MKKLKILMTSLGLVFLSNTLLASSIDRSVEWHGFLTSAIGVTSGAGDDVHYAGDLSDVGGTKDTRFGLNLSKQIDENWSLAAQMKSLGTQDFELKMDWAFASYQATNHTAVRFGRLKYPMGLVNEYIDVGYTYLWIRPPEAIYTQELVGPNVTRVSYNGFGMTTGTSTDSTEFNFDLFTGVVDVVDGHVNQLLGTKFSVNYDDVFRFEIAANTGVMEIEPGSVRFMMMDDQRHTTFITGISVELTHFILMTEFATTSMGAEMMDTDSGYITLGYRLGKYTPHFTFDKWDVQGGWGQEVITLGLRREIGSNAAFKVEIRQVSVEGGQKPPCMMGVCSGGAGLFDSVPDNEEVNIFAAALEFLF